MEYVTFGRTRIKISRLCLGSMNFGGRQDEIESIRIIDQALEKGSNFIDTANVYGYNPQNFAFGRGSSEIIVGKALQGGKRDRVVLATKVHYPMSDDPNAQGNTRRHILEACDASLKRLKTDTIDLYQLYGTNDDIQDVVLTLANEKNVSGYAMALARCMHRPGITSAIIEPRTVEQLSDSLTALEIELDETEMVRLNAVSPPESYTDSYIQYKGPHRYRW